MFRKQTCWSLFILKSTDREGEIPTRRIAMSTGFSRSGIPDQALVVYLQLLALRSGSKYVFHTSDKPVAQVSESIIGHSFKRHICKREKYQVDAYYQTHGAGALQRSSRWTLDTRVLLHCSSNQHSLL